MVVVVGEAVTEEPVVELRPVPGDQEYETPPPAVKITEPPEQRVEVAGLEVMVGNGLMFTVTVVVLTHPGAEVPVTV
jgi:hypothetical protein